MSSQRTTPRFATGLAVLYAMLVLLFVIGASFAQARSADCAEALSQDAIQASSPQYGEEDVEKGLRLLDEALQYDPDHERSLDYRATLLASVGRTAEAVADLERLFALRGTPETGFSLCMAREYLEGDSPRQRRCYHDVVSLYEARIEGPPYLDGGYLLALRMADEDAFETALNQALAEVGPEADMWGPEGFTLEILRKDRQAIVEGIYGFRRW